MLNQRKIGFEDFYQHTFISRYQSSKEIVHASFGCGENWFGKSVTPTISGRLCFDLSYGKELEPALYQTELNTFSCLDTNRQTNGQTRDKDDLIRSEGQGASLEEDIP